MESSYHHLIFFFFNDTATTEIYTLSLHDALPIFFRDEAAEALMALALQVISSHHLGALDRKSTRLNSSHVAISYAVFCLKKKNRLRERLCVQPLRKRRLVCTRSTRCLPSAN